MFNRRKTEDSPQANHVRPEGLPDVWVMTDEPPQDRKGSFRYFFIEQLTPDGIKFLEQSLEQQLLSIDRFQLRSAANSVALSWHMKQDDARDAAVVREEVRLIALGVLADHFGWQEPEVGTFESGEARRALAKKLGVTWTLGEQ